MIGKTISHYKILEKLGEGGMGVVYKAEDTKLKRAIALKFLPPELTRDPNAKNRFIHEARAASALDHPNICTIHEIDETENGQMFIAMAYYSGNTLKRKIEDGPLKLEEALDIFLQLAEGLAKAHEQGIVHRDLKSANVMINEDGVVKIVDFGLAKLSGQTKLTKEGTTLGTVAYMSPEQTRGDVVDHRTDIWALGIVLYQMLTGKLPFKGDYDQAVVYSILNEEPEFPDEIPSEFQNILKRSLTKNPEDRYKHVDDLAIDARCIIKELESVKSAARQPELKPTRKKKTDRFRSRKAVGRSISQRLSKSSIGAFVGRKPELETLMNAFSAPEPPFVVAYIHGPGGIGKSFLLQNLISRVASNIGRVVFLDCRNIEPTATGFLDRLSAAIGQENGEHELDDVLSHLSESRYKTLLCLDQYENFTLMDTWLRQVFIPALPDTVLTVIASRYAPKAAWFTTPGWQDLFKEVLLKELSDEESTRMLETRRLNTDQIQRVKLFAHGYPLALELGAAALHSQPNLEVHAGPSAKIVSQLSRAILSGISREMMEAVEAMSTVRWTTEPIMRALLDVSETRSVFDKLRDLPVVYSTLEGLILHEVVQEAVSKELLSRDPERYCLYRSRAWCFFSTESQQAQERHLWHLTADMLYLIENPAIREAFFPKGSSDYVLQPATKGDYADIVEIARDEEPQEAAGHIEMWLNHYPDSFSVAKGSDGKVAGFYFCFEPYKVDDKLLSTDPLTAVWSQHLEKNPVKSKERVLFLRRWLARETGESFSPVQGACWVDIKRTYMEMRPHLRRLYTTVNDLAAYAPVITPLCFVPIDDAHVKLGGRMYYSALLDFGEGSVDGWLKSLVKAELGVDSTDV